MTPSIRHAMIAVAATALAACSAIAALLCILYQVTWAIRYFATLN